jgi:hypothetical protein
LNSFNWDTWTFFLRSAENVNRWGLQFFTRRDQLPFTGAFESVDRSLNYNAYVDLLQNENRQLKLNATYRALQVYRKTVNQNADRALLGRVEYIFNEWNGGFTGNTLYELGSGQEQRRDFSFLEVPAGQGEYTWNDYNGGMSNGRFQQLIDQVRKASFESSKVSVAKQALRNNNISVDQLKSILNEFSFESTKLQFAKDNYSKVINKRDFFLINDVFTFQSSKDDLNQFLERQQR